MKTWQQVIMDSTICWPATCAPCKAPTLHTHTHTHIYIYMYMGERGTISHFPRGGFYDSSRKVPKAKCEMVPLSFFGGADAAIYKTLLFWRREFVAIYSTLLVLKGEFVAIYSTLMTLMFEARSICCYLQHFALLEAIM